MRVRIARAEHDAQMGVWRISFPYDEDLIAELKDAVPSSARSWAASRRQWVIEDRYGQAVLDLLSEHGLTVQTSGAGSTRTATGGRTKTATDGSGVYWEAQYNDERKLREQTQAALVSKTRELAAVRSELSIARLELMQARQRTTPGRPAAAGTWAAQLKAALPGDLQDRAYKALLRVLHPDVGGSTDLAKDLNTAFRK